MVHAGVTAAILLLIAGSSFLCVAGKVGFGPGEQDWGHVTVRKGAHMFYWLYYTTASVSNYTERPLTIWLQGGPGASSTGYGNFEELGPLDLNLNYRNHTWVKDMNVLFIDNPVGSGFSYVDDYRYLTTDNKMIALDLVEFMRQFYKLHPEFKKVPLHIFCESYGGKMAAEFALELDKAIKLKQIESNFKSVALGDSWVSPMDSVDSWAPLLLEMGVIDHDGHKKIMNAAELVRKALHDGQYRQATSYWSTTQGVLLRASHGVDFYNILKRTTAYRLRKRLVDSIEDPFGMMFRTLVQFDVDDDRDISLNNLMNGEVRKKLNISNAWGSQSGITFQTLSEDFMKPVIHIVEALLNTTDINVVVFSGQLDLICATPGTVIWINKMKWPSSKKYELSPRLGISVNGVLEGYYKKADNFTMYWVNRAGHMVPNDNPAGMSYILKEVTNFG